MDFLERHCRGGQAAGATGREEAPAWAVALQNETSDKLERLEHSLRAQMLEDRRACEDALALALGGARNRRGTGLGERQSKAARFSTAVGSRGSITPGASVARRCSAVTVEHEETSATIEALQTDAEVPRAPSLHFPYRPA